MRHPILLFDTEYTAWEGSQARRWSEPWEHREIVQIASVQFDRTDVLEELPSFNRLVKPSLNPVLSPYFIQLTGIQQQDVDARGVCFRDAFMAFYAFCDQGRLPLFCWGDDPGVLSENCALNGMPFSPFPAGIYDIRVLFQRAGIDTTHYSSGTIHKAVGVPFDQAAHNALSDVLSLSVTLRHLLNTGALLPASIEDCMAEANLLGPYRNPNGASQE